MRSGGRREVGEVSLTLVPADGKSEDRRAVLELDDIAVRVAEPDEDEMSGSRVHLLYAGDVVHSRAGAVVAFAPGAKEAREVARIRQFRLEPDQRPQFGALRRE